MEWQSQYLHVEEAAAAKHVSQRELGLNAEPTVIRLKLSDLRDGMPGCPLLFASGTRP